MSDLSSRTIIGIGFGIGSVVAYVAYKAGISSFIFRFIDMSGTTMYVHPYCLFVFFKDSQKVNENDRS